MGRKRPERAWGPVGWPSNVKHSTQQKYGTRGHNKKNTEYDCWAFIMLIWLNKNLRVFSLKECKLLRFQQVLLNCSSKDVLVISCKTEKMVSGGGSMKTFTWSFDLIVDEGRFQTFQSTTTTTKVAATRRPILKSSSSMFVKKENISEGATRKRESVTTNRLWLERLGRQTAAGPGLRCAPAWVPEPTNVRGGPRNAAWAK